MVVKGPDALRTIAEAAGEVGVAQHVLRFWESRFGFIRPIKGAGGRRFYRPNDILVLRAIRRLLHDEGYSINEVKALHKERGLTTAPEPETAPMNAPPAPLETSPPRAEDMSIRISVALARAEAAKSRLDRLLQRPTA